MKYCPSCNAPNPDDAAYCQNCGAFIQYISDMKNNEKIKEELSTPEKEVYNQNSKSHFYGSVENSASYTGSNSTHNSSVRNKNKQMALIYNHKNETLAAILSFLIPGLGQVYVGKIGRGITLFILSFIGLFLVIGYIIVWAYSVYDAYRLAKYYNYLLLRLGRPPLSHEF